MDISSKSYWLFTFNDTSLPRKEPRKYYLLGIVLLSLVLLLQVGSPHHVVTTFGIELPKIFPEKTIPFQKTKSRTLPTFSRINRRVSLPNIFYYNPDKRFRYLSGGFQGLQSTFNRTYQETAEEMKETKYIQNKQSLPLKQYLRSFSDLNETLRYNILEMVNQNLVPSFKISRNPVLRLFSAFKSKFRCDDENMRIKVDRKDRSRMVKRLQELGDGFVSTDETCLSFDRYVSLLLKVKKKGIMHKLDHHIINQNCLPEILQYQRSFHTETVKKENFFFLEKFGLPYVKQKQLKKMHKTFTENGKDIEISLDQLKALFELTETLTP
eukprot:snap_masked-scaffold_5-processed-gene-15.23-mRNA-1 protein AED:0.94 eAED:1.00 QI:0/0/0/0.33/1/1/3/0/324